MSILFRCHQRLRLYFFAAYSNYFRQLIHKNPKAKLIILWLKEIVPILLKVSIFGRLLSQDSDVSLRASNLVRSLSKNNERGLFIDCGSNIGQGFNYFKGHYKLKQFDYELFEPNENCYEFLLHYPFSPIGKSQKVNISPFAVSDKNEEIKFYGINKMAGGDYSQAGSINIDHNFYDQVDPNGENYKIVTSIRLADFILNSAEKYKYIVLKLDVEGAEYKIITDLITSNAIDKITTFYVEFHSRLYTEPNLTKFIKLEEKFILHMKDKRIDFCLWH